MKEESVMKFDASKIIQRHLDNIKTFMIDQMNKLGRNASHKHVNSLTTTVTVGSGTLWGLQSWNYMETGRGSGKVPRNFQSIIFQWVKDKGIQLSPMPYKRNGEHKFSDPMERAQWTFAGAVAHKIAMSGTALFRSQVPDDIYSSAINRECEAILEEMNIQVSDKIKNINKNAL